MGIDRTEQTEQNRQNRTDRTEQKEQNLFSHTVVDALSCVTRGPTTGSFCNLKLCVDKVRHENFVPIFDGST
jgi:hypothetical protein